MKRNRLLTLCLIALIPVYGQVGINTTTPDPSSILDITSATAGVLLPRMTAYPSNPAVGLTIYRTDLNGFYTWDGANWTQAVFGSYGGTVTNITGNSPISVVNGSTTPSISLSNSGVTPGTYNSVIVDVHGLVTGATNVSTSVSNTISGGSLSTTVNGVTGTSVPINNTLSTTGNTVTSTIAGGTSQSVTVSNLYTTDGALTENRTVTMGNNNLNFTSTNGNLIFSPSGTGYLGIGTSSPTAQLHTTGTVRFAGLGTNTTDTKVLTADANGNIAVRSSSTFLGEVINGYDGKDALLTTVTVNSSPAAAKTLLSKSFTLATSSRVVFNFNVTAAIYTNAGTSISDVYNRVPIVGLNFSAYPAAYTGVTSYVSRADMCYDMGGALYQVNGYYNLGKSREIILPAGTYTVDLVGNVAVASGVPAGASVIYGGGTSDYLDIIAFPIQ